MNPLDPDSAEASLLKQIERLKFVLDSAELGTWDWNPATNDVTFDHRWCSMLGLDPGATPMRLETWDSRVHPDDKKTVYEKIRDHITGRSERYESTHRLRHADGLRVEGRVAHHQVHHVAAHLAH